MNARDRIKELRTAEQLTIDDLSEKSGIKGSRVRNLLSGQTPVRIDDIQAIGEAFPEYKYWLAFGEEMPEAGQISPETKKALAELKTRPEAG
ncbi:helix-turn-helix transcriptional regulator [Oceanobacter sp. 3_MG-2023]|uniref:helix-turn-helix domain-containing protein n=1 Tax=Oceanobacter sp. 3_MG-2023 TaxID=3062622 RepID=UPI002734BA8F|nr:helix-turn-helix transcriptional regulator [Oceanobacter sp. 3_MG-2023]MDP2506722.1 helix-turn-helix transcriptional regulator [Oceanobacter sp. 3_MG-2023]